MLISEMTVTFQSLMAAVGAQVEQAQTAVNVLTSAAAGSVSKEDITACATKLQQLNNAVTLAYQTVQK